jgi:hypothetical protein
MAGLLRAARGARAPWEMRVAHSRGGFVSSGRVPSPGIAGRPEGRQGAANADGRARGAAGPPVINAEPPRARARSAARLGTRAANVGSTWRGPHSFNIDCSN